MIGVALEPGGRQRPAVISRYLVPFCRKAMYIIAILYETEVFAL